MDKPIIFIGGTAGTGKTTLAKELCKYLDLDHRLGTGFIREILRSETSQECDSDLYLYTFQGDNPVKNLLMQSRRLYKSIIKCAERARDEGTSLVIEGNHLIPELYHQNRVNLFVVLSASPPEEHQRRLYGKTHLKRRVTEDDMQNTLIIADYLKDECLKYNVPYIHYDNNIEEFLGRIHERR